MRRRGLILAVILVLSLASPIVYLSTPVRARVFYVNVPNWNMGVLDVQIIGAYEIHLDDLNLSGFFKVGNETVNYYVDIESADVVYSAVISEDQGKNTSLAIKYVIDYRGLNFSVFAESFSISVDYVQISSKGELVITVLDNGRVNLAVYEMIPRHAVEGAQWPYMEIIKKMGERPI